MIETRNQLQEKNFKKNHKHMDAKQYATKQPTDHRSSRRGNKKKKTPRDK